MPPVPFECFIPPNGRTVNITIDVSPDTYLRAEELMAKSYVFQVEKLSTGENSYTIYREDLGDVAIHLSPLGEEATTAVEALINSASSLT